MNRREFLKIAGIASGAAGVLFEKNLASARGFLLRLFPGLRRDNAIRVLLAE